LWLFGLKDCLTNFFDTRKVLIESYGQNKTQVFLLIIAAVKAITTASGRIIHAGNLVTVAVGLMLGESALGTCWACWKG
jgi:hypothetical protein